MEQKAVTVWDEKAGRNVCGLCGSSEIEPGYGLAGGGGCGMYNYCRSCHCVLDKSNDKESPR